MSSSVYLIALHNISGANFLNYPTIALLKERGVTFSFQQFFPLEPEAAYSYLLTGCNPGKTGFFDIVDNPLQPQRSTASEQTILSFLHKEGFSVDYLVNDSPNNNNNFSFINLTDYKLLDEELDIVQRKNTSVFVIAPVFEEYTERAVNINSFLKEKEIIETDSSGAIIWKNSLAYMRGYGQLWINVIGREKEGAVLPGGEYNEVRESLIKGISEKLIDSETGQFVVERIYKKEELFSGEYLPKMPDLVVTLKHGYGFSHISNEILFDESPVLIKRTKVYTAGGGILTGENIRENLTLEDIGIANIAPIVLYYTGCKIPAWMDGKVEEQFFHQEFISDSPPEHEREDDTHHLSERDEILIKERLRGLGYLA